MKKILFVLMIVVIGMTACEGPEGPPGESMLNQVEYLTVNSNEWVEEWDGDTPYYVCVKRLSALNDYIYEYGNVFAYLFIRYNQSDESQTLLPRYLEFLEFNPGGNHSWTESITYDFRPGQIVFYYQYSDFAEIQPPTEHFRIVMNW